MHGDDPVVRVAKFSLGQGTGQLGTQKVMLQSEGRGCPWRSGTQGGGGPSLQNIGASSWNQRPAFYSAVVTGFPQTATCSILGTWCAVLSVQ